MRLRITVDSRKWSLRLLYVGLGALAIAIFIALASADRLAYSTWHGAIGVRSALALLASLSGICLLAAGTEAERRRRGVSFGSFYWHMWSSWWKSLHPMAKVAYGVVIPLIGAAEGIVILAKAGIWPAALSGLSGVVVFLVLVTAADHATRRRITPLQPRSADTRAEAVVTARKEVTKCRQRAQTNPKALADLALALEEMSYSLAAARRFEEALDPIQEAVTILRGLAETHSDAYLPYLATSLHRQSVLLNAAARRREALAPIQEAVALRRKLAEADPNRFLPDLASSLCELSDRLGKVEPRENVLSPIQEATVIYRELAKGSPGPIPARPRLLPQ